MSRVSEAPAQRIEVSYYAAGTDVYRIHTAYCDSPACQATHDDPTKLYDWRSDGWYAEARDQQAAIDIAAALNGVSSESE